MSNIKLKKGVNLILNGFISDSKITTVNDTKYAVIPDDFPGITPRVEINEGDCVIAGDTLFHDKEYPEIKITSPVSGTVSAVTRGERRKILAIIIEADKKNSHKKFDTSVSPLQLLLDSGLWSCLRQRPYDIVPAPDAKPRDIFITAFDSAPLAPDFALLLNDKVEYLQKGIDALSSLTHGKVYLGCSPSFVPEVTGCEINTFDGPHPAGNVGVQIANTKPINKGEVVWTTDAVAVTRLGELLDTGYVNYDTVVAVTGESVIKPQYISHNMGCSIASIIKGNINDADNTRIISGNVLTGTKTSLDGYLRYPYRHITAIPEIKNDAEFMGWATISPCKFSLYHSFTSWIFRHGKAASFDAKLNGGRRAIIMSGEYDKMMPMDIYAEFLIKAIIAFDIEKMEELGIYEVAPEDFALCEFADTSKLELQHIVREGLDRLRREMN